MPDYEKTRESFGIYSPGTTPADSARDRRFRQREEQRHLLRPTLPDRLRNAGNNVLLGLGAVAASAALFAFAAEHISGEPGDAATAKIVNLNTHPSTSIQNERLALGEPSQPAALIDAPTPTSSK